jgi:oligosaccharide repeat unit polymerase
MGKRLFYIITIVLLSVVIILSNNFQILVELYFYFFVISIGIRVASNKRIELIDVWNTSFIFIVLAEMLIKKSTSMYWTDASKYLLIANNIVNIGYYCKNNIPKSILQKNPLSYKESRFTSIVLVALVVLYFFIEIRSALFAFTYGRNIINPYKASYGIFINSLINSLELILPALIAYYFSVIKKKRIWVPLFLSLPVFIILFLYGTRYPLLFSVLGFLIIAQYKKVRKFSIKQYLLLGFASIILIYTTNYMRNNRTSYDKEANSSLFENIKNEGSFPEIIANSFMSPEGVVDMTALMFKHFEKNDHLYGASSSFILYFWVPRAIWPEKPTMLGYWFIRQYRGGFGDAHSASFGFTGDLYADFGLFSLIIVFFLGRLLKTAENFKRRAIIRGDYSTVLGAMFYPFIFFFVRSPITSSMTFLGIIFIYYIMKRVMFVKHI